MLERPIKLFHAAALGKKLIQRDCESGNRIAAASANPAWLGRHSAATNPPGTAMATAKGCGCKQKENEKAKSG
jgi:hypothetical protein